MSVLITNVSQEYGLKYGSGRQMYRVTINNKKYITMFSHTFEDGMSVMFSKASRAVALADKIRETTGIPTVEAEGVTTEE